MRHIPLGEGRGRWGGADSHEGRGGLPVGDEVGRILGGTLSRFSTRAACSPRGKQGGRSAGEVLRASPIGRRRVPSRGGVLGMT